MLTGNFIVQSTAQRELIDISNEIHLLLQSNDASSGVLFLFNPHTTAGLTINEGADPDVPIDIIKGLEHLVPLQLPYKHLEGNSPAHIMCSLMGSSLIINVSDGRPVLGTWQKIFFGEFDGPRTRKVIWRFLTD